MTPNINDERFIIASVLRMPELFTVIAPQLKTWFFTDSESKLLWKVFHEIEGSDGSTDINTVYAKAIIHPEPVDGFTMGSIVGFVKDCEAPTEESLRAAIRRITDYSQKRMMLRLASQISAKAEDSSQSPQDISTFVEQALDSLNITGKQQDWIMYKELAERQRGVYRELRDGNVFSVPTPFHSLNEAMTWRGLIPSDFVVLAAHTSFGKSQMALQLAEHGSHYGSVLVFSLEMSRDRVFRRSHARVGNHKLSSMRPDMSQTEYECLLSTLDRVGDLDVAINDTANTLVDIRRVIKRFVKMNRTSLILVDYLQLARSGGKSDEESEKARIVEISRELKILSNVLKVPIIALSQFSRDSYKTEREPNLADLYGGAIEKDADWIWFLHGEKPKHNQPVRFLEFIVAKARDGELIRFHVSFDTTTGTFLEIDQETFEMNKVSENYTPPVIKKAKANATEDESPFALTG